MRNTPNLKAERFRLRIPGHASSLVDGNCGMFAVVVRGVGLKCIVSDGGGWDHVSVSTGFRCPTWDEMCAVKDLFFKEDEVVMQLHPAKSRHINHMPFCLHLWRPQTAEERARIAAENEGELHPEFATPGPIPLPPELMV